MTLANLLPDKDTVSGLVDISKNLEARRYKSWLSLAGAIISGLFELIVVVSKVKAPEILKNHPWLWFIAFLCFATLFVLLRYTGFLLKQSKEPFRYTVYIQNFAQVAPDDGCQIKAGGRQIELMPNDLMERIRRRLGRFSLLPPGSKGDEEQTRSVSHFQIEAEYAMRKDKEEQLILQTWPRVRVGAASNPFTLAVPVRLPLSNESVLSPEQYERLVERVYSSITTEIYKQIEIDLRSKMELFPTDSLRALARYVEGKDFETSNTIDAYDRAIEMYRTSVAELKSSCQQRALLYLGHKLPKLASYRWTGVPSAMLAQARNKLGLARCLIYRRLVSEMSGRQSFSIFEVRKLLFAEPVDKFDLSAWDLFAKCYNARVPAEYRISDELINAIRMPEPDVDSDEAFEEELSKFCLALSRESEPGTATIFRSISEDEELCETAAMSALAQKKLENSQSAGRFLQFAEAMELRGDSDETHALVLLVKAELEPDLQAAIRLLQQAAKYNPLSEIVLFRLARKSDLLARDNRQVTSDNIRNLALQYETVLKLNPGNIAALVCQGYLYWLVDELDPAAKSFESGIDMESIVSRTYVSDLKYCLARVEAERGIRELEASKTRSWGQQTGNNSLPTSLQASVAHFQEAVLADPKVSALTATQFVPRNVYFDRINPDILDRFRRFHEQARSLDAYEQCALIRSAALNDYGGACLTYFLRFGVGTAREEQLLKSLAVYREAEKIRSDDPVLKYNLLTACGWTYDMVNAAPPDWVEKVQERISASLLKTSACLSPDDLAYVLSLCKQRENDFERRIGQLDREIKDLESKKGELQQEIKRRREKKPAEGPPAAFVPVASGAEAKSIEGDGGQSPLGAAENPDVSQSSPVITIGIEKIASSSGKMSEQSPPTENTLRSPSSSEASQLSVSEAVDKLDQELETCKWELNASKDRKAVYKKEADKIGDGLKDAEQQLLAGARLRSFAKDATKIAGDKSVDWASYEEDEVSALIAYAIFLCQDESRRVEGYSLCERLCTTFYPERFSLLQMLTDSPRASAKLARVLENAVREDKNSSQCKVLIYKTLQNGHRKTCQDVEPVCKELPWFQDKLADDSEDASKGFKARKEACRLAPLNRELRRKLRDALTKTARPLLGLGTDGQEDPFAKRELPDVIECEVDISSTSCLVYESSKLPPGLQDKITGLRNDLKSNLGTILPGVRFRDNGALNNGEFRLLVRKLPVQRSPFNTPETDLDGRWNQIIEALGKTAREHAASIYTLPECSEGLKNISANVNFDPICISNDPDALYSLMLVLKALLAEQVPIVSLSDVAEKVSGCLREGLSMTETLEAVRSVPSIREKLPGNHPSALAVELPAALAQSLQDFVDQAGSDAPPAGWLDLRKEIRQFAFATKLTAKDATLVTNPAVCPLVAKGCAGLGLPVISTSEIRPELLSKAENGKSANKSAAQAAGGP